MTITLLGIAGSLRANSFSSAILATLADAIAPRVVIDSVPLGAVPLYNQDEDGEQPPAAVRELRGAIAAADGLVIATPEYNHGLPGVLKNALDWASRPYGRSTLSGKPVLTVSSSPAAVGGARAHAQLNETLASIAARVVLRPQAVIPLVHEKVRDGRLDDPAILDFLVAGVDDLVRDVASPAGTIREQA